MSLAMLVKPFFGEDTAAKQLASDDGKRP